MNNFQGGYAGWQQQRQNYWNNWSNVNSARLDNFQQVRDQRWDNIQDFRNERWDSFTDRRSDWMDWRNDVWDYRADRADEIRDYVRDSCDHYFTPDWWAGCSWWPSSVNIGFNVNPWWWWRPTTWSSYDVIYESAPPAPIVYDYGTDVVVHDEKVYVDGKETAPAADYRQEALDLGNPTTEPPPPVPLVDGNATDPEWVPMGVWALTQEEKGDAVMFYQLTGNKDGLISGAYSNVLTGESQRVTGAIDKKTQRVAWHTGDNTGTVVEANLNGLTKQQTSVFVHFGTGKTQTWLLVRLPDPDMPTAPTALPTSAKPAAK